jgi:hypothetical protein
MSTTTTPAHTTSNDSPPVESNTPTDLTDDESVAMSISSFESEAEEKPERFGCCECELCHWRYISFAKGETCSECGHGGCELCSVYVRFTEVVLGA